MITTISLVKNEFRERIITLGKVTIAFDSSIKYEFYKNDSYRGYIFTLEGEGDGYLWKDAKYDIVFHYHTDWRRMIINNKEGWKDLPFHKGTYRFLPEQIRVINE